MKTKLFGWESPPASIVDSYIQIVESFVQSEELMRDFKRNPHYVTILSGPDRVIGEISLKNIYSNILFTEWFLENIREFKENDLYGHPVLHDFDRIGQFASDTIKYIWNACEIKQLFDPTIRANQATDIRGISLDVYKLPPPHPDETVKNNGIKKIVEIGGGYGALCKILSHIIEFEEYILIDLPPVVKLCEKYLNNFPDLKNKVSFIGCDEVQKLEQINNIDLFIADSSLAECDKEVQSFYIDKILKKSKFCWVIYNTLHLAQGRENYSLFLDSVMEQYDVFQKELQETVYMISMFNKNMRERAINETENL